MRAFPLHYGKRMTGLFKILAGVAIILVLPQILDGYWLFVVSLALIYFIAAWGYNLLMGTAGVPSFAQAGLFAAGAYICALLMRELDWPFFGALVAAVLGTGIVAGSLGYPALRIGGIYLAIATAGLHLVIEFGIRTAPMAGAVVGLSVPRASLFGMAIKGDTAQFYLIASIALLVIILSINLLNSRTGRALKALRDSEIATEAMGISVARLRTLAFVLSGLYAGLAGALVGQLLSVLSAEQFTFNLGLFFFAIMVIGGFGSFWGTLVAAFVLVLIPEVFASLKEYQIYVYGMAVILILMFLPGGLGSIPSRVKDAVRKRREKTGTMAGLETA